MTTVQKERTLEPINVEDGSAKTFDFKIASVRRGFIRKVYSILMCQLLLTLALMAPFVFHQPTKEWTQRNATVIFWVAVSVAFATLISMACCVNVRRTVPYNYIFLGVFTTAESFLLGVISSICDVKEVMHAIGLTAAVCLALTLFAFQTKWDFTALGGILSAFLTLLLVLGITAIFLPSYKILRLFYASLGALLFSIYLVYDTQLLMGGKHKKYSISPEEYVFAALNLYLDIVNLFLDIISRF